ncbi:MAG: ATP-binding protein [Actinobacteria bacterium]|jgi:predicted AAA+ superfamily ATPase|nr:MAG: ATP-binding protein [Actinomycetota bacterium]
MRDLIRQKIIDNLSAQVPDFTKRDVYLPRVSGKKAYAVIGMRRSGKTTFLWQALDGELKLGTPREDLVYLNFEDERLSDLTQSDLGLVAEEYYNLYPESHERRVVFFLDEIQNIDGWEAFTRRLLDTHQVGLFISGSSSRLLSRELASGMRGRALELRIYPFSFREFLRHLGREPKGDAGRLPTTQRSRLERDLRDYLTCGGFPEAVGTDVRARQELLRSYVDVAVLRDVIERHAVSHPVALRYLVRQLLGNPAGSFSINKFYNDLRAQGIPVAKDTLHSYLSFLEDAFLLRTTSLEARSVRRRMVNPRKVYPIDPGLIPIYNRSGEPNLGHALETCVLLELERRGAEVGYVRTASGYEVDLHARFPGGSTALIQACTDIANGGVYDRELRALLEAKKEYPRAMVWLIVLEKPPRIEIPKNVHVSLASSWLLETSTFSE